MQFLAYPDRRILPLPIAPRQGTLRSYAPTPDSFERLQCEAACLPVYWLFELGDRARSGGHAGACPTAARGTASPHPRGGTSCHDPSATL
jgi:hypothetical protein